MVFLIHRLCGTKIGKRWASTYSNIIPTLCPKLSPIYVAPFHFKCASNTLLQLYPTLWPLCLSIFIGCITLHNYGTKICIIMNKNALKIPNIMALMQLRNSGIIRLPTFWHHLMHFTHLFLHLISYSIRLFLIIKPDILFFSLLSLREKARALGYATLYPVIPIYTIKGKSINGIYIELQPIYFSFIFLIRLYTLIISKGSFEK